MTNVICVSTSNNKFKHYEGREGLLFAKSGYSADFYPNNMLKHLITSVINIIAVDTTGLVILKTLNSVYIFQIIDFENTNLNKEDI